MTKDIKQTQESKKINAFTTMSQKHEGDLVMPFPQQPKLFDKLKNLFKITFSQK